eukprot:CAMPEP_0118632278 /NCGR_PEP_ID=MMETSP0785-20121206/358_1 /TAXON_ID=91992 /ORGANISM="Bolidomonas pacifica, Strain CCMP 1866" /LENGTH=564 /DNA_ID=CAMNT_0006523035 /DNA_START=84 /DNA_END=1777 /DNA_ORIENTATION=+
MNIITKKRPVPSGKPVCDVELERLTTKDTVKLGDGLQFFLKYEADEADAIDKFIEEYKSMRELDERHLLLREMLEGYCKEMMGGMQKWAKAKLFVAAALSIGDLITDVIMIVEYYGVGYATASLASLLANLFLQSFASGFQNRGLPLNGQLREQLYIWTLVKPGVDAWRVASGTEHEEGKAGNPMVELYTMKVMELVAEAIPGAVIQLSAMLTSESVTTNAIFSFGFCIFTASFTSAIFSWDFDMSKENRKMAPAYYGYTPNGAIGKVVTFLSLYFLSAFNLFVRTFACVLFAMKGGFGNTAILLGSELLLYCVIKLARRDLWYWAAPNGAAGLFGSLMTRWVVKVVVDWTALVQLRHPNEVGGGYFSFSFLLTIAMGIYVALDYNKIVDGEANTNMDVTAGLNVTGVDNEEKSEVGLEESTVLFLMLSGCLGMVISYSTLLSTMERKYLPTFLSWQTSCEMYQDLFTEHDEDALRFWIFDANAHKWEYKIGEEVRAWLNERLPVWLEEEPEWFNPLRKSWIPDRFVDDKALLLKIRTPNVVKIISERRRSSVGLLPGATGDLS